MTTPTKGPLDIITEIMSVIGGALVLVVIIAGSAILVGLWLGIVIDVTRAVLR